MVIGDGRLTLAHTDPVSFDVIVIDAFSSDAIPMHLLTREFLATVLERLRPAVCSPSTSPNVYFDLEPVVGASVRSLGATALSQHFQSPSPDGIGSEWVLAARQPADLAAFASDPRWQTARVGKQSWTDDRSNIFDAISFR